MKTLLLALAMSLSTTGCASMEHYDWSKADFGPAMQMANSLNPPVQQQQYQQQSYQQPQQAMPQQRVDLRCVQQVRQIYNNLALAHRHCSY